MSIAESILLGLALAMDCFTVSIASGTIAKRFVPHSMAVMVTAFGAFQGGMVLSGWYVSRLFSRFLEPVDHWVAFGLLAFIGVQMIREGFGNEKEHKFNPLDNKVIFTLAIATSIDALAVGVSMAFMQIHSWNAVLPPAGIIALISSLLTLAGLATGIFIGRKMPFRTEPIGGIILIGIGIHIIIGHLS